MGAFGLACGEVGAASALFFAGCKYSPVVILRRLQVQPAPGEGNMAVSRRKVKCSERRQFEVEQGFLGLNGVVRILNRE